LTAFDGRKVPESHAVSTEGARRRPHGTGGAKRAPKRLRTDADAKPIERDLAELGVDEDARRIAREHGALMRDVLGSSRMPKSVAARDALIDFLCKRFRYSTPEVGKLLKMDHSSVLEAKRRHKERTSDGQDGGKDGSGA